MEEQAPFAIEIADRFVIAGRRREYMARVRRADGRVLYSSGWERSRRRAEERATLAQHALERQGRQQTAAPACRVEIEQRATAAGMLYLARVRCADDGHVLFESEWHADARHAEQLARTYAQHALV